MGRRKLAAIAMLLVLAIGFVSCGKGADPADDSSRVGSQSEPTSVADSGGPSDSYPANPVRALREALENDREKRGLALSVGSIEPLHENGEERKEFMLRFTDGSDNACVISFITQSPYYDFSLEGHENPSFLMAFKDADRPQDIRTVLTSVIGYLAPELDARGAEQLAAAQIPLAEAEGFMPQDIGGYQVQAHRVEANTYFTQTDFTAKLEITVTALQQIWGRKIDKSTCEKLSAEAAFRVLDTPHQLWDAATNKSRIVYADFMIRDLQKNEEPIHGDTETRVTAESPYGVAYALKLDTMKTPYEFAIGEKYTLFMAYHYGELTIVNAVQLARGREESAAAAQ